MSNPFEKAGAEAALINGAAVNMKKVCWAPVTSLRFSFEHFSYPSSTYNSHIHMALSQKADRLAVWLNQSNNMEAVISVGFLSSHHITNLRGFHFQISFQVGKLVKERLQLEPGTKQVRLAHVLAFVWAPPAPGLLHSARPWMSGQHQEEKPQQLQPKSCQDIHLEELWSFDVKKFWNGFSASVDLNHWSCSSITNHLNVCVARI